MNAKNVRKIAALLLLVVLVLVIASCSGQTQAAAPAPAAAAPVRAAATGPIPPRIDMTMPSTPITLRLAHDDPITWPATSVTADPEHAYSLLFKDFLESQSGGAVKLEIFGAGALGTYRETLEMVQTGALDINIGTGSLGSFFKPFQLFTIPFLFSSDDVASTYFAENEFWMDQMAQMEREIGLRYLSMGQNGWRNLTNNTREIRTPEDLRGIKFRVMQNPVYVRMIESMGGSAVPIAWNELYTALQTGVVDAQENPISSIYLGKIYEVQKFITMSGHVWSENVMSMNSNKYASLPLSVRHLIDRGALLGVQANDVAERMVSNIAKFDVVAQHMQVYFPTAGEKARFGEVSQPAVIEYLKGEVGASIVDGFLESVQRTEAATGWRR